MGALLIDHWLDGREALQVVDEASIALVREHVREEAMSVGFAKADAEALVIVASELAHNQRVHAIGGLIAIDRIQRGEIPGLEIIAADQGQGIIDPTRALEGGASSAGTLGIGLSGARRMADEVDIDVRLGGGTALWARKFARPAPRRREVAILGRPLLGESVSGDHAFFGRSMDALLLSVIDGLGHGEQAQAASCAGIQAIRHDLERSPRDLLERADVALRGTRGAVMAIARVDETKATITHAAVGDTRTAILGPKHSSVLPSSPGTLRHTKIRREKIREETIALTRHDVLVMSTDGLSSRASLPEGSELLRAHPMVIAHYLFSHFAKAHDDALVAVAR